jgi:hypothetical protein
MSGKFGFWVAAIAAAGIYIMPWVIAFQETFK